MDLLLLIVTCAINLVLGAVIVVRDVRKGYAQLFLLMSIVISLWIITNYFTNHYLGSDTLVHVANRIAFFCGYGIVTSGLVFTYFFPVVRKPRRSEAIFLTVLVITMLALSLTSYVSGEAIVNHDTGTVTFTAGPLVSLYLISFLTIVGFIAKNLLRLPQRATSPVMRQRARLVLLGFAVSALTGLTLNLIIPLLGSGWQITRLGPISTVLLVVVIAYAIIKHGLFDIRLATVRSVAYGLSLLSLSLIYYLLAYVVSATFFQGNMDTSVSISPVNIALALLLAFAFQPIKAFFDNVTNSIFYRDQYNVDDFIAKLSAALTSTNSLRTLLERASVEISSALKAEQAFFYVYYNDRERYVSAGTEKHAALSRDDVEALYTYVSERGPEVIVAELVAEREHRAMYQLLEKHKVSILLPLVRDTDIVGYLAVGEKLSGNYAKRDIKVLTTIADELIIAIQNTLSVQEIRDINTLLEQRIAQATQELRVSNSHLKKLDKSKDEFISMASHQLRTPLTSVKGYISMVLEGDVGPLSDEQHKVLRQAYESSQRMVFLINDFLNVSRLQTGKFELEESMVNLANLTREEVDQLADTAHSKQIKISYQAPSQLPLTYADENKLRQVMMNFMDNAIFYSPANSEIRVQLYKDATSLIFKVTDSGIGVPKSEQAKLFTKFFRATNARQQRPDGTGIGLYMAKKVIVAHGGTVVFESKEGRGSTFGFRLPLKDDPNKLGE